jgi:protocatechuate 3,4-dioxygenase beta subunit
MSSSEITKIGYPPLPPGTQPKYLHPAYVSSIKRAPTRPLIRIPQTKSEITGPTFIPEEVPVKAFDLTAQRGGSPLGERIVVSGRVLDEYGRPIRGSLIEVWQANSAGRYAHANDAHDAPLDPNFTGCGATFTDDQGRYQFVTIRPGCYPWRNHYNAWRPAHIHFSLFGPTFATRLVTQMYFPGDPLLAVDPIFNSTADESARQRLISSFDWEATIPETALGFRFDIILRGPEETPMEVDR